MAHDKIGELQQRAAVHILAPDEIEVDQYVIEMTCEYEIPSFMWSGIDHVVHPIDKPIKIRMKPYAMPKPRRVLAICYPFVLCIDEFDDKTMVDLRQIRLGLVCKEFARLSESKADKKIKSSKRKSKKKRKK